MFTKQPDGIVVRINNFTYKVNGLHLSNKKLDVVLLEQPGMNQGRREEVLVGAPADLQIGEADVRDVAGRARVGNAFGDIAQPNKIDHIVFLLDTSSSMKRNRLQLIKNQIGNLGKHIPLGTRVSLISFDREANLISSGKVNSSSDFEKLIKNEVDRVQTDRGTNILSALEKASSIVKQTPGFDINHPQRNLIVLITDGEHMPIRKGERIWNEPIQPIFDLASEVSVELNAPIISLGVGVSYNESTVHSLAGYTGGAWSHISSLNNPEIAVFGMSEDEKRRGAEKIELIPELMKQIAGGECFIRCDRYGSVGNNLAWATTPTIHNSPSNRNRLGLDSQRVSHELRGGFWQRPDFIVANEIAPSSYFLAGQTNARLSYGNHDERIKPDNYGRELEIVDPRDIRDPSLRHRFEETLTRWLKTMAINSRDPGALEKLRRAGILTDEAFSNLFDVVSQNDDEVSRSQVASQSFSPGFDISNEEKDLISKDFLSKIEELVRVERVNDLSMVPLDEDFGQSKAGSVQNGDPAEFSGGLGPLDDAPVNSLPDIGGIKPDANVYKFNLKLTIVNEGRTIESPNIQIGPGESKTIGRHPDCGIQILNARVSRVHCKLFVEDGKLWISDSTSSNGTYVNNKIIDKKTEIKPLDVISLCDCHIIVKF